MSSIAELLIPAIRWDPVTGYDGEREAIGRALALGVGGFILFGGPEAGVRTLTKELRTASRIPLLIGAEMERGAAQQFPGTTGLPPIAAIASLGDWNAVERAAKHTAREARTIGVNWNLAPVCGLDAPNGAALGTRSLGDDPERVAKLAAIWIESCQREGVVACAKHFPGYGRAVPVPDGGVPVVTARRSALFESDFVPFRAVIGAKVASIIPSHASYPALDASRSPAWMSTQILRYLLRERLGFDGLVVSDALAGSWVTGGEDEPATAIQALDAGCDLLLFPTAIDGILAALEEAVRDGPLDEERILQSRRRRLKWAQWAAPPTDYRRVSGADIAWANRLVDSVVGLVRGRMPAVPAAVEVMVIGAEDAACTTFREALRASGIDPSAAGETGVPLVIALVPDGSAGAAPGGYGKRSLECAARATAAARSRLRDSIVIELGAPEPLPQLLDATVVLCAWSSDAWMQEAAARMLMAGR